MAKAATNGSSLVRETTDFLNENGIVRRDPIRGVLSASRRRESLLDRTAERIGLDFEAGMEVAFGTTGFRRDPVRRSLRRVSFEHRETSASRQLRSLFLKQGMRRGIGAGSMSRFNEKVEHAAVC